MSNTIVMEEAKAPFLAEIAKLLVIAADQHEIYSLVPAPRAAEGQRKDDRLRMSRLKCKTFDGDYKAWKSWYEQYLTAVHNNEMYRNPQIKLMYLHDCLAGEPLELVSGFETTAENYPHALKALTDRYSNPQLTYVAYRKELEILPPAEDSVASLHGTVNKIRSILSNLRSYGVDEEEDDLRSLMVQKFSVALVMEAYSFGKLQPACRTEDLLSAVAERVTLREWVETLRAGKTARSETPTPAPTAMMAGARSTDQFGGGKMRSKKRNRVCAFCNGNHKADGCKEVESVRARRDFLKKQRKCFICLEDHFSTTCPSREKCGKCNLGFHHPSICMGKKTEASGSGNSTKNSGKNGGGSSSSKTKRSTDGENLLGKSNYSTFLQSFMCYVEAKGRKLMVRGLLDTGCDTSYIEVELVRQLGIELRALRTTGVQGFGSTSATLVQVQETTVVLASRINGWKRVVTVLATACLAGQLRVAPPPGVVVGVLPSNLQYADPSLFNGEQLPIKLLIGNDLYYEVVKLHGNRRMDNGLVILNTVFGYIPAGRANLDVENYIWPNNRALVSTEETKVVAMSDYEVKSNALLQRLWDLETLGIRASEFMDVSAAVIEHFRSTCRFENGRYVVCWPWKGPKVDLKIPTNYRLCVARLKGMLRSTPLAVLQKCEEKFREQLTDGIIEVMTVGCHTPHYLPYKPIMKENKLRIVYDASAKTKSGRCLNDFLHAGPSLTKNLVGMLIFFRFGAYGLLSDVEKAYHMVGLDQGDWDVVRFLWVEDYTQPELSPFIIFRFTRVPFGVVSSPFLLNMVIQELLAAQLGNAVGDDAEVYNIGRSSFYVDNLVTSVDTTLKAERVCNCLTTLLQTTGMNLRDWTSNSQEFCQSLPMNIAMKESVTVSVLGLLWNRIEDTLSLQFDPFEGVLSKRTLLSAVAQVYDPLGLVAPCMLTLKLCVQSCWAKGMSWDDPIPVDMEGRVRKLLVEREEIRTISIPCRLWTSLKVGCTFTMHVFTDASRKAYGCAVYLMKENPHTGLKCSSLIYTKQRLAPCKQQGTEQLGDKAIRPRSKQARRRAVRLVEQTKQNKE